MSCPHCDGCGWRVIERGGLTGAERCPCQPRPAPDLSGPPARSDVMACILLLEDLVPFFPRGKEAKEAQNIIADEIERFVGSRAELSWLGLHAARHLRRWSGIAELRALHAARFTPADGVYIPSEVPGFTAEAIEADWIRREGARQMAAIEAYRAQWRALPPAERAAPLMLPAPRPMPQAVPERFTAFTAFTASIRAPRSDGERAQAVEALKGELTRRFGHRFE